MRRAPLLIVFAVVAVSCTNEAIGDPASPDTTTAPPTTAAPASTPTVAEQPPGIEELPEGLQLALEELIAVTERLRGLEFIDAPKINVVTPGELERLVRQDIAENVEDVDVDQALYRLLGLVDDATSLLDLYTEVLGEQVAGFYDTETEELVVPIRAEAFGALERSTIVHELTHALTDQHFDFGTSYEALIDQERFDEAAAYQAVIEGDAVLTELTYLRDLTVDEQREVIEQSLAVDSSALDSAPRFLQESLIFPYVQGQGFVDRLFQLEGRPGIDAAYSDPPVSTEQILTPEDYGRDLPLEVTLPELALEGYELEYDSVWGELSFELMFNQVLGSRSEAAEGWGGDRYQVFFDGTEVAMVLRYRGDGAEDAAEMEAAMLDYLAATLDADQAGATFQGEDFGHVTRQGDEVLVVVASDPGAGATLLEALAQT